MLLALEIGLFLLKGLGLLSDSEAFLLFFTGLGGGKRRNGERNKEPAATGRIQRLPGDTTPPPVISAQAFIAGISSAFLSIIIICLL